MFFYLSFFISLDCYCLHDHRFKRVKNRKERKKQIYNTKHGREWFLLLHCVFNKCQKVIPHSVITWTFFLFHYWAHSLEISSYSRMEKIETNKKRKWEKCREIPWSSTEFLLFFILFSSWKTFILRYTSYLLSLCVCMPA